MVKARIGGRGKVVGIFEGKRQPWLMHWLPCSWAAEGSSCLQFVVVFNLVASFLEKLGWLRCRGTRSS